MANILVRGLDDDVVARLKASAAANGHSLQAEIREALSGASLRSLATTRRLSAKWLAEATAPQIPVGRQASNR
jgi:plasmid stability protein